MQKLVKQWKRVLSTCLTLILVMGLLPYTTPSNKVHAKTKSVKTLQQGKTYSYNLDKQGKKEKLSYSMSDGTVEIKVNGTVLEKIEGDTEYVSEAYMQVMDIDEKDKRMDLWVYTYGSSNDVTFSALYQYSNKKLERIWKPSCVQEGMFTSADGKVISTDGKGKFTIIGDRMLWLDYIIGNHWDKAKFQLKDGKVSRVSKKNFDFYQTFPTVSGNLTYVDGVPKKEENAGLILKADTKFYTKHNQTSETFVVAKEVKCYPLKAYVASNTQAYVLFETENGEKGWLCTLDYENKALPFSNAWAFD